MLIALVLFADTGLANAVHAARYRSAPPTRPPIARTLPPRLAAYRENQAPLLLTDFGQQYLYAPANQTLPMPAPSEKRVVFFGDSITDFWNLATFFPGRPYVNRGISGQVTPQMVVRFHADVVALKPKAVVILAGVNDVSGVLQTETEEQVEANYAAFADLATANRIKPIFAKILPINRYNQTLQSIDSSRNAEPLRRLNAWLESFCRARGYALVDYGKVLAGPDGQLRQDYSIDGLHPSDAGYAVMAPVVEQAILAALRN